ncbi:hypothetical protein [Streptomyces stelliscabiei]|uniref:hypothetical protein n=1 Tax=Streptomyces stelliscabiei TaxID=146820 RepID=UPI002FF25FB6
MPLVVEGDAQPLRERRHPHRGVGHLRGNAVDTVESEETAIDAEDDVLRHQAVKREAGPAPVRALDGGRVENPAHLGSDATVQFLDRFPDLTQQQGVQGGLVLPVDLHVVD